jgi:hypothetical protein
MMSVSWFGWFTFYWERAMAGENVLDGPGNGETSHNPPWLQSVMRLAGVRPDLPVSKLSTDEKLDLFLGLQQRLATLNHQIKLTSEVIGELEGPLVEYFTEHGQQRVTRRGSTIYLSKEYWPAVVYEDLVDGDPTDDGAIRAAKDRARERLLAALQDDPATSHMVKPTFNWTSLRSMMLRDFDKDDDGEPVIPPTLDHALACSPRVRLKASLSG